MMDSEVLYLIGPGGSIQDFNPKEIGDNPTLNFSGTMDWFYDNNIYPNYWCFIDPFTVEVFLKHLEKHTERHPWLLEMQKHTTLLYNDFQGTDEFYNSGFTTSQGPQWNRERFGGYYFPLLKKYLKESIPITSKVTLEDYSLLINNNTCPIIKHPEHGKNTDKFTSYVLPLAIHYFTNLKKIICTGFGDYDNPRAYTTNAHGYEGFKLSYQTLGPLIKDILVTRDIDIIFKNTNSYYKDLEWKK